MRSADATNEAASARSATGAVTSEIKPPAAPGPAADATTRLASNFAFASIRSVRATTVGRYACEAISNKTESDPLTTAMTYRWGSVKIPSPYATGAETSKAARPRSAATMTGRRRTRSTQTPAAIPNKFGRLAAVDSNATSYALAGSTMSAVSG